MDQRYLGYFKALLKSLRSYCAILFVSGFFCFTSQLVAQVFTEDFKTLPIPYDNQTEIDFGTSLDVDSDYAVVGAPGYYGDIGCAYVFYNSGTSWEMQAKLTTADGGWGEKFGNSVSISGDIIVVGAYANDVSGVSTGSAYVFEKPQGGWANMTQTAKLTASDGAEYDAFGYSVSIYGDLIVIGAGSDDDSGDASGSAYVFTRPQDGWTDMTQTAKLKVSDGADDDRFGSSVSVYSNVIVVGAYGKDVSGVSSGSAYVFEKPQGGWTNMTQTAKLTASDGADYDRFGSSVSVYSNVIVVGAYSADGTDDNTGAVYVFEKPGQDWTDMTQTAKLTESGARGNEMFGIEVCISDDVIVSGSPKSNNGHGAAFIFEKPGEVWTDMTQTAELTSSDRDYFGYGSRFGAQVSISGDEVFVGAADRDDELGVSSGSVYIYKKPIAGWINNNETQIILPVSYFDNVGDRYGSSSSLYGDYAVVGSNGYNVNQGCAYVLHYTGSFWETLAKLTASDGAQYDRFGCSVSISGDVIVVGATFGDDNGISSGAAYVFEKPQSGWTNMTQTAKLTPSDGADGDQFGHSVSISANVIVVGAISDDDSGDASGSAYVFARPQDGWTDMTQTAKLSASDGSVGDSFGQSVCVSNNVIAVGAYYGICAAYVFEKPGDDWTDMTQTAKLIPSDGSIFDAFGHSVSISGDIIVSSASSNIFFGPSTSSAYVFEKPQEGWTDLTQMAKLTVSDGNDMDCVVRSVRVLNNVIVVGVSRADATDDGSVYIFVKPAGDWTDMTQTVKLKSSDGADGDLFGFSVDISDEMIIVGAPNKDRSGSAYIFQVNSLYDDEPPTITCIGNTTRSLLQGETAYLVVGSEFDPVEMNDNFGIESVLNDFNSGATLEGASIPIGTTTITWTVLDTAGNNAQCSFDVMVTASTGIDLNLHSAVYIYPNPTKDILVVEHELNGNCIFAICTMEGKIVLTQSIAGPRDEIDVSSIQSGIYIVTLRSKDLVNIQRFLIK